MRLRRQWHSLHKCITTNKACRVMQSCLRQNTSSRTRQCRMISRDGDMKLTLLQGWGVSWNILYIDKDENTRYLKVLTHHVYDAASCLVNDFICIDCAANMNSMSLWVDDSTGVQGSRIRNYADWNHLSAFVSFYDLSLTLRYCICQKIILNYSCSTDMFEFQGFQTTIT